MITTTTQLTGTFFLVATGTKSAVRSKNVAGVRTTNLAVAQ